MSAYSAREADEQWAQAATALAERRDEPVWVGAAHERAANAEQLLALGRFRLYALAPVGGALLRDTHLFDVKSVSQAHADAPVRLALKRAAPLEFRLADAAAAAAFLARFQALYRENLPLLPSFAACRFRVDSARLAAHAPPPAPIGPCGGLARAYSCCCAFYDVAPRGDVLWTIDALWDVNGVRELALAEFDALERAHCKALLFALRYNDWFDAFVLSDARMPSGGWSALASCMATNSALTRLELSRVAELPKQALARVFASMHENRQIAVRELDISRNTLDSRDVSALALLLSSSRLPLHSLSLHGCTLPRKAIATVLNALEGGAARHLRMLDLSRARLASGSGSAALGRVLAAAPHLEQLSLTSSDVRFGELLGAYDAAVKTGAESAADPLGRSLTQLLLRGCRDSAIALFVRRCTALRVLDISETVTPAGEVAALLSRTAIATLAVSGMGDVWSEKDVFDVLEAVRDAVAPNKTLRQLEFDCNFRSKPKDATLRARSIDVLASCLGTADTDDVSSVLVDMPGANTGESVRTGGGLLTLSVRGDARNWCARSSLLPLLLSLAGASVRELDVRSNQLGDEGAVTLARAMQANSSIRQIAIDNNGFTLLGFRRLLDALERNYTLVDMSLPVIDGAAMLQAASSSSKAPTRGTSLALAGSSASSRFEARDAPNVLAELHAVVMRNVQLAVLDARRRTDAPPTGAGARKQTTTSPAPKREAASTFYSLVEVPASRRSASPPPLPADDDDDDDDNDNATAGSDVKPPPVPDDDDVGAAPVPPLAPDEDPGVAPPPPAEPQPEAVSPKSARRAAEVATVDDATDLDAQIAALEAPDDAEAEALAREQEALEAEQRALEREMAAAAAAAAGGADARSSFDFERGSSAGDTVDEERAALEAERAAIAAELEALETGADSAQESQQRASRRAPDDLDDWDSMSPQEQALRLEIEKFEIEIEQNELKLVDLFDREQKTLDSDEDENDERDEQLEDIARERRKVMNAIEEAEMRVESLNSKLKIGNFEGARQQEPVKATVTQQKAAATPTGPFGISASMLNKRAEQLSRASKMRAHRQSTLRPSLNMSSELGRLLGKRKDNAESAGKKAGAAAAAAVAAQASQQQPAHAPTQQPAGRGVSGRGRGLAVRGRGRGRGAPARDTLQRIAVVGNPPSLAGNAPTVPLGNPPTLPRTTANVVSTSSSSSSSPSTPSFTKAPAAQLSQATLPRLQTNDAGSASTSTSEADLDSALALTPRGERQPEFARSERETVRASFRASVRFNADDANKSSATNAGKPSSTTTTTTTTTNVTTSSLSLAKTRDEEQKRRQVLMRRPTKEQLFVPKKSGDVGGVKPSERRKNQSVAQPGGVAYGDTTLRKKAHSKPIPVVPPADTPKKATLPRALRASNSARRSDRPALDVSPGELRSAATENVLRLASAPAASTTSSAAPTASAPSAKSAASPDASSDASAHADCAELLQRVSAAVSQLNATVDTSSDTTELVGIGKKLKSCKPTIAAALDVVPNFALPVPSAAPQTSDRLAKLRHILRLTLTDLGALLAAVRAVLTVPTSDSQLQQSTALLNTVERALK